MTGIIDKPQFDSEVLYVGVAIQLVGLRAATPNCIIDMIDPQYIGVSYYKSGFGMNRQTITLQEVLKGKIKIILLKPEVIGSAVITVPTPYAKSLTDKEVMDNSFKNIIEDEVTAFEPSAREPSILNLTLGGGFL